MFEVCLSRRDCHEAFLITIERNEKEFWRMFKRLDIDTAFEIFRALDSFLHKLEKEGFVYQPKTEMLDERELESKE